MELLLYGRCYLVLEDALGTEIEIPTKTERLVLVNPASA